VKTTRSINSFPTTALSLFILLVCCLISYWPVTFHVFSLKNDALNYFLPVRYQISEAISNGYWPFWSPYFNLGYPLHGDMQSGVWNPFVQLLSLFGPYNLKTLQCETLLYVYLSGVGMFFLVEHFCKDRRIAVLIGGSFMLCGFNSDSSEFLNWICGASFLPFIFLFYYRMLLERSWKMALSCGLFLYLLFVTAYPADFILTGYLLLFVLIWHFFSKTNRGKKNIQSQLLLHLLLSVCFLLLSLPAIISYAEFLPLTERGAGASYSDVMSNSFHPGLLLSYVTPLPTWKAYFADTDRLLRNSYFGLLPLTAFLIAFFIKFNQPVVRFCKWAFIVSLLFSFGEIGGLRVLAFYLLPLMNAFRHPANARLFTIFFACLSAAFTFQQLWNNTVQTKVKKRVGYFLLVTFGALLIWSFNDLTVFSSRFGKTVPELKSLMDTLSFSDFLLINVIIQIPFLIAICFWLFKKMHWKWMVLIGLTNSSIHTFLYQPLPVVKKDSVDYIQSILNTVQKKGYVIPDINATLLDNSQNGMDYFEEIGVSNMYNKKIGRVDYRITPSNLLSQNQFWSNRKIRNILFQYPLFYKADTIFSASDSSKITAVNKRILLRQTDNNAAYSNNTACTTLVTKFTPLNWQMEIVCAQDGFYCLFQNYYPRWKLWIDGKKQNIEKCNISFIGFALPAGKHSVTLQYKTSDLLIAFFISVATLLVMLSLLLIKRKPPALQ
jgi:hypothetical protein